MVFAILNNSGSDSIVRISYDSINGKVYETQGQVKINHYKEGYVSMELVEIKSETEEYDSYSDDLYNITSWGADLSFREIISMYKEEDLLKPEMQRNYVWDKIEASRFIDSLLMGLPVPSIFLAKLPNEKQLIVDGYQRIMTVYDYVHTGLWSRDKKVFKLSNSEVINKKWKGKSYKELDSDEQRRIRNTTIHAIIFEQKHPKDDDTSLFQVFERINTSGRTLTPQEIRNCIYQGPFNTFLIKLNGNPNWRKLYGSEEPDNRMRDMELILRFFALNSEAIRNSKAQQISLKKHLNLYMSRSNSLDPSLLQKFENEFSDVMAYIFRNIGRNAFHNISKSHKYVERFHPTIFDAISISTAVKLDRDPQAEVENLEQRKMDLLRNEEFQKYISERTTNIESINGRINLACNVLYGMEYIEQ